MAKFELNDDGVVVIIGSGAGGGTLAHELTRRGIKVVLFEAGKRQSLATFSQVPGEAFGTADVARAAHAVRHVFGERRLPDLAGVDAARPSAARRFTGPRRARAFRNTR